MAATDGTIVGTTQIVNHGPAAHRFNIVIMAEGYRNTELGQFAIDVQTIVDTFRNTIPFCYVWESLNFFRVDISSTDSGADDPSTCGDGSSGSGTTPRTYFDASFCTEGLRRALGINDALALSVAAAQVPSYDFALVLVNSTLYGGLGGSVAKISRDPSAILAAIHEMGHTVFHLADEYSTWRGCDSGETDHNNHPAAEPTAVNVTTKPRAGELKWGYYVLQGTTLPTTSNSDCTTCDPQASPVPVGAVGAFEGADYYHCGSWRPEFDCRMRNQATEFCRVCKSQVMSLLYFYLPYETRFAWKGFGADWNIYIGQGLDLDQSKLSAFGTGNSPALAVYNGTSMAWRGAGGDQRIWYSNLNALDGVTWSPQQAVPNALTSTAPALAPFNGKLYMAWKGAGGDQSLWFSNRDFGGWSPPAPIPNGGTSSQPALCAFNNRLVAVWKGISGDQGMYYSTFDGNGWQPQRNIPGVGTSHYPGLAVFGGRLYMAWKGAGNDLNIYYSTFDGANWSPSRNIPNVGTSNAPSLSASGGTLYMAWVGIPGDPSLYFTVFDGITWRPQNNYFGVGSSAAPAVLVH